MTDLQKRIKVYELRLTNLNGERELLSDINSEVDNAKLDTSIGLYMEFLIVLESLLSEKEKEQHEKEHEEEREEKFVDTSDKPNNFFDHEEPEKPKQPKRIQNRKARTTKTVNKTVKQEQVAQEQQKPVEQPKTNGRRKPITNGNGNAHKNVVVVSGEKGSFSIYNETGGSIESGFQNKPSALKFAKDNGWNVVPRIVTAGEIKR